MDQKDYREFTKVWMATFDIYGRVPSDSAVDLAFQALARFGIDEVKKGLTSHINDPENGRFFPKPADVVRNIDGDSDSRALKAWSKVEKAVRSVGSYETVIFDEPAIMASIENLGGWIRLCQMKEDELPFRRNEFVKLYKGFLINPPEQFPNKLIGISEGHNQIEFQDRIAPPVIIGDRDKAMLILEHQQPEVPVIRNIVRRMLEEKK